MNLQHRPFAGGKPACSHHLLKGLLFSAAGWKSAAYHKQLCTSHMRHEQRLPGAVNGRWNDFSIIKLHKEVVIFSGLLTEKRAPEKSFLCANLIHSAAKTARIMSSVSTSPIRIKKVAQSRYQEMDESKIQFGKVYADHMLTAHYANGVWGTPEIGPFGPLALSPATTFMHYGQAIFEGIKAYKDPQGNPVIFRPYDNWQRFNKSAERMAMPAVPEEIFMEGLRALINIDRDWIPSGEGTSLYLRPFMIATDEFIGVRPAEHFTFMIITSPAGPYYSKPVSIYVQDEYVRAFPGGTGFAKNAGNYGACMYPTQQVRAMGYDQILWTDGFEHRYVQEIGTMNVFFKLGDTVVTPDLEGGTILAGVTRDSIITLLREHGTKVEERPLSIDEIAAAYKRGELMEAFGAGTAASIAPISDLTYMDDRMMLPPVESWETANWLKEELSAIRYGRKEDAHGWIFRV